MVTTFPKRLLRGTTGAKSNRVDSDSAHSFKNRERSHRDVVVFVVPVGTEFIPPAFYDSGYNSSSNLLSNVPTNDEIDRMSQLESIYELRKPTEIKGFLAQHDRIIPYLFDAYNELQKVFGKNIPVRLDLFKDPYVEDYEQLFGYIDTRGLTPEEAFQRMEAFDEAWYLDQVEAIGKYLNFNLE